MTVPQHLVALTRANQVRLSRALLRRDIASGWRDVAEVILEPPEEATTATILDLLKWQHRWGRARGVRFLARLRDDAVFVSETRLLRDLTRRERALIAARLAEEHDVPAWPAAA